MRASGILLPVSSLPSRYGIGGFTQEAYDWIDFLEQTGQTLWQILPLGHTSYGDSPYQPFSTTAGNPYFVSLDDLIGQGLLTEEECDAAQLGTNPSYVDYAKQFENRFPLLRLAYERDKARDQSEFEAFWEEEAEWLPDYALFMALKKLHGMRAWSEWDEPYRTRDMETLERAKTDLADDISFYAHVQFWFFRQWERLKAYAEEHHIRIVGDLPIYVAFDSVDVWTHPELFQLDENLMPVAVAGVPPDFFSEDGQLWGNPLYDWDRHRETGYTWWIDRIRHAKALYDLIRIDHFRGLDEYYAVPYGRKNARRGEWRPGPGMDLLRAVYGCMPDVEFIAEDLGALTQSVQDLLAESGLPGMRVLEFAFDTDWDNHFLPHNYDTTNCVVYTGTHDNETMMQFLTGCGEEIQANIKNYLDRTGDTETQQCDDLIRLGMLSIAKYCVIPMQDYLHLGGEARINFPSTLGGNWEWRMRSEEITDQVTDFIRKVTTVSARWRSP